TIAKILSLRLNDIMGCCRQARGFLSGKSAQGLAYFIRIMDETTNMLETHLLSETIHNLILRSGLSDHYDEKDRETGTSRVQNLDELINAASQYPAGREGLAAFLETTLLNSSDEDPYAEEEKVTLITLHNTKGLEFDRVIITGLEEGLFPYIHADDTDWEGGMEEERRLFYVGITRAKKKLHLTTCYWRRIYGQEWEREPSRFIYEIPRELISGYGEADDNSPYTRGEAVYHRDYGEGQVQNVWLADGDEWMMIVQFGDKRKAEFICKYAPLERIG
ncbi:MAG: ATP-binding domain-containing protein, partial [Spirochaetales bacterium]|nr:ATP-binding domain-containing protein [Spirochaetales bacterium]